MATRSSPRHGSPRDRRQHKAALNEEGHPVASTEPGFTAQLPKGGIIPLTGK